MSNKEFYDKLLEHESNGLIAFCPKLIPAGYYKVRVGKRYIAVHQDIVDFGKEITRRDECNLFFTHSSLQDYLDRSQSVVTRLVIEGEYEQIKRGGTKFYLKKDW